MAGWISPTAVLLLGFVLLIDDVEFSTARGARGRSFSRMSSSKSTGSRSPYKGTHGYTAATWVAAFSLGRVYGGQAYLGSSQYSRYPNRMPTICKNINYAHDVNGSHIDLFVCPQMTDPNNYTYCCGPENKEYCCAPPTTSWGVLSAAVILPLMAIVLGVLIYYILKRRQRAHSEKKDDPPVPEPTPKVHVSTMNQPPPPYSTVYMTSASEYSKKDPPV